MPNRELVDLSAFLEEFERVGPLFRWRWQNACKLRTTINGVICCPVQVLAFVRGTGEAATRPVPDRRDMVTLSGMTFKDSVAVIHHADGMTSSRYWQPLVRKRMVKACGLREEP